ncbi:MAG: peptidoglycan-binding domain-containing protein [bacterium]
MKKAILPVVLSGALLVAGAGMAQQTEPGQEQQGQSQSWQGSQEQTQPQQSGAPTGQGEAAGLSSSTVRQLQQELQTKGYNPGPIDGQWGPKTSQALTEFQRSEGLSPTGSPGQDTLQALGIQEGGQGVRGYYGEEGPGSQKGSEGRQPGSQGTQPEIGSPEPGSPSGGPESSGEPTQGTHGYYPPEEPGSQRSEDLGGQGSFPGGSGGTESGTMGGGSAGGSPGSAGSGAGGAGGGGGGM